MLDVLQRAGVNVLWLDNNSDSKDVALRVPYKSYKSPEVKWDVAEAIRKDLGKCKFEAVMTEMSFVDAEAKYACKHLRGWMKPTRVRTPLMAQPGRSYIEHIKKQSAPDKITLGPNISSWD